MKFQHVRENRTELERIRDHVRELATASVLGNRRAFADLHAIAVAATESLKNAYSHAGDREELKEMLAKEDTYPVLHSWKREINKKYQDMLVSVDPLLGSVGPWKTQARSGLEVSRLLRDVIVPHFDLIRAEKSITEIPEVSAQIQALPVLTAATVKPWACAIADWLVGQAERKGQDISDPKTFVYQLANPQRQAGKRIKKGLVGATQNGADPITLTKKQVREVRLRCLKRSDITAGLQETIGNALKRLVKNIPKP